MELLVKLLLAVMPFREDEGVMMSMSSGMNGCVPEPKNLLLM
jgi:hypothetical protein